MNLLLYKRNRDVARGGAKEQRLPPSKDKMIRFRNKIPFKQVLNGERTVAPPGNFIGGKKCWGLGRSPRKFFFDHALCFGYKRDQRPPS